MHRRSFTPRHDWRQRAAALGFAYAEIAGEPYWDEAAAYEFTADEIDVLEAATADIEALCHAACAHAVRFRLHDRLGIPAWIWPVVVRSWERQEKSLYGRLDLCWDGAGAPKLLEYNADTPTALYEAAVIQWEWLQCAMPGADQFNSLHEALIAAWPSLVRSATIHFACMRGSAEDRATVDYLRDTATQARLDARHIDIEDIGWNGRTFTGLREEPFETIFKLYPWEWLLRDPFGAHIPRAATHWIEPAWRLILSGKGILALLWELFPDHPNLLPAYLDRSRLGARVVSKPFFGREGQNVSIPGLTTSGSYTAGPFVHQAYQPLPNFRGRYPVIGSWIVAGVPAGIGIREDATLITRDTSRFVPHYFMPRRV